MKKTLLTILCAMTALFGMAQTEANYTEQYVVSLNGTAQTPQDGEETVVANTDGTVNFTLKNFSFEAYGTPVSVGDLTLNNLSASIEEDGLMHFEGTSTFSIPVENLPANLQALTTYGVSFDNIPVKISGKMNDEKLYALININMASIRTQITVEVGTENFNSKVYHNQLMVIVNDEIMDPQDTDVTVVDNGNGTINFELKNFFLGAGEEAMPVGSIVVENLVTTEGADGYKYFSYDAPLTIQPGDLEGYTWVGPVMGEIPINLQGKMNDEKLYVTIDIDLGFQVVRVLLGYANVYTEPLVITLEGTSLEPQEANVIVVDNGDNTINFLLKNFILGAGDEAMYVGNIYVENINVIEGTDGLKYFSYNQPLTIRKGSLDLEDGKEWIGPGLGEIPVDLNGKMNDKKLYVTIDIDFGISVAVQLGTDDFVLPSVKTYPAQPYYVTFKGVKSGRRSADIEVLENSDATIDFTVKDLVLTAGEMVIPVGDLTLHALKTEAGANGRTAFSGERTIYVSVDKLPQEYQAMVSMSGLTEIPVGIVISGWYDDEKVYADIDASMQLMGDWQFQVQIGFARGDVNCDGTVDIADVVSVLNAMAGQTVDGDANVNGDYTEMGEPVVDIADVVSVLNIMAGVK